MVRGLEIFKAHFKGHEDKFILIGGTATGVVLDGAGLEARTTKDLDIVLIVEALDAAFATTFWAFIEAGGYQLRQEGEEGKPRFYRFQKPTDERYPIMLELFSRTPEGLKLAEGSHLTPIPVDESVSSLSAILLDDNYYDFITGGRHLVDDLPILQEDRLIPLKAKAWLDLKARRVEDGSVDARDIRKHMGDIVRLSQLFGATTTIRLSDAIAADVSRFLTELHAEGALDLRSYGTGASLTEVLQRIATAYQLDWAPESKA